MRLKNETVTSRMKEILRESESLIESDVIFSMELRPLGAVIELGTDADPPSPGFGSAFWHPTIDWGWKEAYGGTFQVLDGKTRKVKKAESEKEVRAMAARDIKKAEPAIRKAVERFTKEVGSIMNKLGYDRR